MQTYTDAKLAIARSISHDEIALLIAENPQQALSNIDNDSSVSELGWSTENDGTLDVYGKRLGGEFRIWVRQF